MKSGSSDSGYSGGSRQRIMKLLLEEKMTIDGLATALGLTRNAVRAQIALLEREGMVEVQGEHKGPRRPSAVYGPGKASDAHFSRAYPAVLAGIVGTMADRLMPKQMEAMMRETGKRLADAAPLLTGGARERVDGAVQFLGSLGATAAVVEEKGMLVIKGHGCPISRAVQADGRACLAIEELLAKMTGLPVRERCGRGPRPGCRFEVSLTARQRAGQKAGS